jgi:hypothetical protein
MTHEEQLMIVQTAAELKESLLYAIKMYNDDKEVNPEYLRGQVELSMFLLGETSDNEELYAELENAVKENN